MAEVWAAETEPVAGVVRTVALKRVFRSSPEVLSDLVEEARVWVRLHHPNIVSVIDFGEWENEWFLVLELVDGTTAAEIVRELGPLERREALCVVERVARALAHAHSRTDGDGKPAGLVHRDVKSANVMIARDGGIKLTDFGVARALDRESRTEAGMLKGSAPFMSPEQARGEPVDARSDLFSLGATMFNLLTGRHIVEGGFLEALRAIAENRIAPPPESLPPAVRDLLRRLTAGNPKGRPASADEVVKEIRGLLSPAAAEDFEPALAAKVRKTLEPSALERRRSVIVKPPANAASRPLRVPAERPPARPPEPAPVPAPRPSPEEDRAALRSLLEEADRSTSVSSRTSVPQSDRPTAISSRAFAPESDRPTAVSSRAFGPDSERPTAVSRAVPGPTISVPPEPPPDGPESPPERAPRRLEVEQERPTGAYAALHPSELPMPGIPEMLPRAEAPAPGLAATASSRRLWIVASMVIAGAAVGIALLAPSRHPTPSELNAPLTVMGKDAGEVLVDGNDLGQCRPGVPLQLSLPVGRHEVRIHGTGADLVVVVQLPDDARVQYQLKDRVIHVDDQK